MRHSCSGLLVFLSLLATPTPTTAADAASASLQLVQTVTPIGRERFFGRCLAARGDLLVVGAASRRSGALYVYRRVAGSWALEEILGPSDASRGARFGRGCDTDGERIVAGAPGEPVVRGEHGAAYVFRFESGRWEEKARLVPFDGQGLHFGRAVAIAGGHVVVGAPRDGSRPPTGGAYAFRFADGAWRPNGKLTIDRPTESAQVGFSVALDGRTLVVGSDSAQGWLRVFELRAGVWVPQQTIRRIFGDESERFGSTLDLRRKTMVAGYRFPILSRLSVFRRGAGTWERESTLSPSDAAEGVEFGRGVAVDRRTLVIGARDFSDRGNAGSAYVFRRQGGRWVETDKLFTVQGAFSDFGFAAAVANDDVIVSDPLARGTRPFSGAVHVFRRSAG